MLSILKRSLALLFLAIASISSPVLAGETREWQYNLTEGVTTVSRDVYHLHMIIFYICCVIGVIVFGAMFISMFLHRKSRGVKASQFHESVAVELVWTIVPTFILIAMAWLATGSLIDIYDTDDADIDIIVTGHQWKWQYEYRGEGVSFFSNLSQKSKDQIYSKEKKTSDYLLDVDNPLVLPVGKKIRFLVTANDVIHSWWVPDLAVKRDAIPGYINEAWTRIEEPGEFVGQCAELCGKDHGYMPIEVKAVSQADYDLWLSKKREEAAAIAEAAKQVFSIEQLLEQGEQVYTTYCAACHLPNGQGVPGAFPAIVGSAIATGDVTAHLDRVINGGVGMPPFGEQLTPVQSAAVITYQRNAFGNNMGDMVQPVDVVNFKQGQ